MDFGGIPRTSAARKKPARDAIRLGRHHAAAGRDLARIGGFQQIRPFLADDYVLGNLIAGSGLDVALSGYAVETLLPADSWKAVWRHLLRWSRTIGVMRPWGHAGLIVTHGTVWSLLALAVGSQSMVLTTMALCCLIPRFVAAWLVADCVDSREVKRRLWLLPLADVLAFLVWLASFFGSRVYWRGEQFQLDRRGRMARVAQGEQQAELTEEV